MDEFASTTNELLFFIFMIILITFILAVYIGVFSGMVNKIREIIEQIANAVFVILPLLHF